MNQDYNLLGILKTLNKWTKPIAYATLGITILSAIILLVLPNYYQASTKFYAGHPDLSQPAPVGNGSNSTSYIYGTDNDLDRLFSLSTSSELYNYLINKYDLYNHYDIDPEGKKAQVKIRLKLNDLYQTLKTEYGAINLSVEDKDPVLARDMANDAREKINELSQRMVKASQLQTIKSFDENLLEKQTKSIILNDSLSKEKEKYKIYNSRSQGEIYAEIITTTSSNMEALKSEIDMYKNSRVRGAADSVRIKRIKYTGSEKRLSSLEKKAKLFNSGVSVVEKLTQELSRLNDQISLDKERKRQLEASYKAPYSALLLVEAAETPLDKSRPRRTILLAMIGLAALLLSILIAFLVENYRKINWSEIKE